MPFIYRRPLNLILYDKQYIQSLEVIILHPYILIK